MAVLVRVTVTVTASGLGAAEAVVALRARMRASHWGLENIVGGEWSGSGGLSWWWERMITGTTTAQGVLNAKSRGMKSLLILKEGSQGDVNDISNDCCEHVMID